MTINRFIHCALAYIQNRAVSMKIRLVVENNVQVGKMSREAFKKPIKNQCRILSMYLFSFSWSPFFLLRLAFCNTKHFNLTSLENYSPPHPRCRKNCCRKMVLFPKALFIVTNFFNKNFLKISQQFVFLSKRRKMNIWVC